MSTEISPREYSGNSLLETAVFTLDRLLRWRRGVFEYSLEPRCVFRLEQRRTHEMLVLADGTRVRAGGRVLVLHLWNEHVPLMGCGGPTLAWAHKFGRAMRTSLQELVRYLAQRTDLSDVRVLYADVRVSGTGQAARAARTMARYGFEITSASVDRRPPPQRMADALFYLMMAHVTNPNSLRGAPMRHGSLRVFMSRAVLEQRYGVRRPGRVNSAQRPGVKAAAGDRLQASPESRPSTDAGSDVESPYYCP